MLFKNRSIYKQKIILARLAKNLFSEDYVRNFFLAKAIRNYRRAGIVFVHIPKAAGSSICHSIYGRRVGHFTLEELETASDADKISQLPCFTMVRHPYSRVISAYEYAKSGGGEHGAIAFNKDYGSELFSTFDIFLNEWLSVGELRNRDRVFWPQQWFVKNKQGRGVDHVGTLQEPLETENWLLNHGFSFDSTIRVNAGQRNSGTPIVLTSIQKKEIQKIYAADFSEFEFEQ